MLVLLERNLSSCPYYGTYLAADHVSSAVEEIIRTYPPSQYSLAFVEKFWPDIQARAGAQVKERFDRLFANPLKQLQQSLSKAAGPDTIMQRFQQVINGWEQIISSATKPVETSSLPQEQKSESRPGNQSLHQRLQEEPPDGRHVDTTAQIDLIALPLPWKPLWELKIGSEISQEMADEYKQALEKWIRIRPYFAAIPVIGVTYEQCFDNDELNKSVKDISSILIRGNLKSARSELIDAVKNAIIRNTRKS